MWIAETDFLDRARKAGFFVLRPAPAVVGEGGGDAGVRRVEAERAPQETAGRDTRDDEGRRGSHARD